MTQPNSPADRAGMIGVKNQHLAVLKQNRETLLSQLQILEENFEAYAAAEKAGIQDLFETIQKLDATIENEAKALFHLQSSQTMRPAPQASPASSAPLTSSIGGSPRTGRAPMPAFAPEPASPVQQPPAQQPAQPTVRSVTGQPFSHEEAAYWRERAEQGKAGRIADHVGGKTIMRNMEPEDVPDPARIAAGYDVQPPPREATVEGVKRTQKVAQWEMPADPDFSAADDVDDQGIRTIVDGKRHPGRIRRFDQWNRLISDEAMDAEVPTTEPPPPATDSEPHATFAGANGATTIGPQ